MELFQANRQWVSRPDDQRFLSLEELNATVKRRREESWTTAHRMEDFRVVPDGGDLMVATQNRSTGMEVMLRPTNWSFNQLCQSAGAPSSYLTKLPAELAAINLQWGLESDLSRDESLVLAHENGDHTLTALTSTTYGRIWDEQVVQSVMRANVSPGGSKPASGGRN